MISGAAGELGPVACRELAVGPAAGALDVVARRKVRAVRVGARVGTARSRGPGGGMGPVGLVLAQLWLWVIVLLFFFWEGGPH